MSIVKNLIKKSEKNVKASAFQNNGELNFISQTVMSNEETVISLDRVKIEVPAGAVSGTLEITIEKLQEVSELSPGLNNTTAGASGYRFKPDGAKFLKPIKVTLPYDSVSVAAEENLGNLYTYFYNEERKCWEQLERVAIDTVNGTVTSLTTHFTDMINGVLALPETAKPLTYNPNSIKEIKAADPGAGINLINPPQAGSQGNAGLSYPLEIPSGRNGMQPQLAVQYNSDGGNGWMGLGWDIPLSAITVDTRWGVPRYSYENETETYSLDGMQMTPLAHRGAWEPRTAEKVFQLRTEGSFGKIMRHGDSPDNYWWEVTDKQGTRYFYGGSDSGVIPDAVLSGEFEPLALCAEEQSTDSEWNWIRSICKWPLTRVCDTNGNTIEYTYEKVRDSGIGDGTGWVSGTQQIYLKTITYTGVNGTAGLYSVNLIRDRELGETRRSDVSIDGRAGFRIVTADLLRKIEVNLQDQLIRSYEFLYQTGAFQKTLLKTMLQYGQDGSEFNRHEFSYYDEVRENDAYNGFSSPVIWDTGNDNLAVDISGPGGKASVLGSSRGSTTGTHLYLGIGLTPSKAISVGFKTGHSHSSNEDLMAFIDLNGDGLPDKVFKMDGHIWFQANNGPAEAPLFDDPVVLNISTLGQEKSSTTSFGAEAYLDGSSVLSNTSHTITTSNIYFSDVNSDGLPDLVINGKVYFNRPVDGVPTFVLDDSAGTPVPVSSANVDTNQLVRDFTTEYNALLDASPLMDTLRVWRAPFAGTIALNAPVRLTDLDRADYATADGVRVAIQKNTGELWHFDLGKDDHTWRTPTGVGSLAVAKGDRIYFRVSSVFDGAFDQVEWDPEITYLNVTAYLTDANGLTPYHYKASQDFVCAGRGGSLQMPLEGTIRINGDLQKTGPVSDDIRLVVYQNDNPVISRHLDWDASGTIAMGDELSVQEGDNLTMMVECDSPIDLTKILWGPEAYYTAAVDPSIEVTDLAGNPNVRMPVLCCYDIYQPVSPATAQGCWVASQNGTLTVLPQINLSGAAGIDGEIIFTIKKPQELIAKAAIAVANGQISTPAAITVNVTQGDKLYFDYSSKQQALNGKVTVSTQVYYTLSNYIAVPSSFHCAVAPYPNSLPDMYRGWGYVAYNGNRERYAQAINESDLLINDQYGKTANPNVFLMVPDSNQQRWTSQEEGCWIAVGTMSSSRLGNNYIAMPRAVETSDVRAVNRIGTASQSTTSAGAYFTTISDANGSSYGELDFIDMNGDGFPDIVGNGRIQYSTPTGGLEPSNNHIGNWLYSEFGGKIRGSENHARIGGISGNSPGMIPSSWGKVGNSIKGLIKWILSPLGINYNVIDEERTRSTVEMIDINGDGLPDQVWLDGDNIMVALNLGYDFADPEIWGSGAIMETTAQNQPLTSSPSYSKGYNKGDYSFSGGVNLSSSQSKVIREFVDINGDGLVDMVIKDGSTMYVAFNTGNSFAAPVQWLGAPDRHIGETANNQRSGGFYFTYAIKIPVTSGPPLYLIINPGADVGWSMGRRETSLMDVTGDGCPDFVVAGENGQLQVSLNRVGITNKLKGVARPLGASFEVSYHREGNTFDLPHKRWVLDKVALQDGHSGDGVDTQLVTYRYSGGKYDRLEREFYGFRQVTAEYRNPADNSLLKSVITQYLTDSFYTKGLVESVETRDAGGNLFGRMVNQYRLFDVETATDFINTYPGSTIATVFPQLVRADRYLYEGQPNPGVMTYQTFEYDKYGNVTHTLDAGNIEAGDDVEAHITYHEDLNFDENFHYTKYIVGKPKSTKVYGNGMLMRHREADYDNYGNLSELRQYLADGKVSVTNFAYYLESGPGPLLAETAYADVETYSGRGGTLRSVTGPANINGERYTVWYNYDPLIYTHVIEMTDSFGYVSSAEYNYLYGVQKTSTDINGNVMRKEYDNFGRVTKVFSPYDGDMPSVAFAYYPEELPAKAVTKNKLHFDPLDEEALDTVLFTDGLKRVIQTKKEAEVLSLDTWAQDYGMTVSGKAIFDALGRVIQQGQPVFEAGHSTAFSNLELKNPTINQYDILDRATLITLPDASTIQTVFTIEDGQFKTTVTDPEGKVKHSHKDIRGNTVKVAQFNNGEEISTTYGYDPLSQIVRVTDDSGNITEMVYDLLGRRISINNPDRGLVEYKFDRAGNLVRKVDANLREKGEAINYSYQYNRLDKIHYPEHPDVEYTYGHPGDVNNRAGRIYQVTDAAGTTETFYGRLGEAEKTIRTVNLGLPGQEAWIFETEAGYDYLGRIQWMTYPDGEKVTYAYNKGGLIKSVHGTRGVDRYDYVRDISYDEFGQRVHIKYGNNIETTYFYYPYRRWLDGIYTHNSAAEPLQDIGYFFDKAGNITKIRSLTEGVVQDYEYDDLYQLVRAEGMKSNTNQYIQTYDYDSIGNMTRKTSFNEIAPDNMPINLNYDFTYEYEASQPHAPSKIGDWVHSYDLNGNTVQKTLGTAATEYFWDEENRLLRAKINGVNTDFLYDAAGNRTIKRGPQGETIYVSEFYQIQNRDQITKHIFLGTTRVASKLSRYNDPNLYDTGYERSNIYTYHPDHIGSSNLITDVGGNIFQHIEYMPYGETWIDEGTNLNILGYRFTGKELDSETGLYYFGARYLDPQNSRWLSPDPALPQYMPEMPLNDDARQRNGNLPGMGGAFNPVNMQLYHYAANNPLKYVDPDGKFSIVGRKQWGANNVIESEIRKSDYITDPYNYYDTIVIHHTTRPGNESIRNLQQYFQNNREYADIGYHFVIGSDGTIYEGRPINIQGAHVEGGNKGSIGIVLLGNFHNGTLIENLSGRIKGVPHSAPATEQITSLKNLIDHLDKLYGINYVGGHKDYAKIDAHSDCPGNIGYQTLANWGIFTKEKGNVPDRPLINNFSDYLGCP